jgi:hypothetical protein
MIETPSHFGINFRVSPASWWAAGLVRSGEQARWRNEIGFARGFLRFSADLFWLPSVYIVAYYSSW